MPSAAGGAGVAEIVPLRPAGGRMGTFDALGAMAAADGQPGNEAGKLKPKSKRTGTRKARPAGLVNVNAVCYPYPSDAAARRRVKNPVLRARLLNREVYVRKDPQRMDLRQGEKRMMR